MEVEGAARVDECSILQAIVLELLLVLVGDAESLDSFIVSEFQVCFSCAILYQAKHLDGEDRILKEASIATDWFIVYLSLTNFTLILNLYKLNLNYEPTYLYNH